jgi:hypothetical protein
MHPEPLIRVLADDGFKGMIEQLGIGFHVFLDVAGMDQFQRFLNDETMCLEPISNHEHRQNRGTGLHCQDS